VVDIEADPAQSSPMVNLTNILPAAFLRYAFAKKFKTQTLSGEKLHIKLSNKKRCP